MRKKVFTLVIIHDRSKVLLGMKKRGFGVDRWNGFGGKVISSESIAQTARRETKEEIGIDLENLEKRGKLIFQFQNNPAQLEVHLFSCTKFTGKPRETQEMRPQWFNFDQIPYNRMWPDDIYWLPLFLEGKTIQGKFLFKDQNTLLSHVVKPK